ncbi:MAG TPA: flagellar basal body-associated FliL family protein [Acidimicrobiales bacterium]|nr:flagellar basal body-associated FliL family protein [Acidimicrobiales bacterium]
MAADQGTRATLPADAENAADKGADKGADKDGKDGKPKKSKKKLIIILVVLLVVGFEAKSMLLKPHYKPGQAVPAGTILPLDQLTVNMSDGHLVQASISLQLTTLAAKTTSTDVPRFDDAAITVLGAQTYDQLLAPGGRTSVKAQILKLCQGIAPEVDGAAEQVSAVYFTSFVVQ